MVQEHIVIGSGPTGTAAACALIGKGHPVRMVDVGLRLEDYRQRVVDQLAGSTHDRWDPAAVEILRSGANADSKGLALKQLFGSDFPYRDASEALRLTIPNDSLKPSFALGGLSNVWGAAVMPYNDRDLRGWPLSEADLAPHYRAVAALIPMAAERDDLAAEYPLYTERPRPARPSRQAARILEHLRGRRGRLARAGIRFGHSRIAMQTDRCRQCGLCLAGCPDALIYNSRQSLDRLRDHCGFSYESGLVVRTVEERGEHVLVRAEDTSTGAPRELRGIRCLIAAGVLSTARIVLESLGWFDRPVSMIDSQYSILPLLALRGTPGVEQEETHTLCQLYLEVGDPALSDHGLHCQLYTYNDLFKMALDKVGGGLLARMPGARAALLRRLMVAACFLHSDDSGRIEVRLERGEGGAARLVAEPTPSPRTARVVRGLARKLLRHTWDLGFVAAAPALHITAPGRSFHTGGAFPMSNRPGDADARSDVLGRPAGWRRIHLVDASVFPTIPANTITYTAMANAHRIAAATADL